MAKKKNNCNSSFNKWWRYVKTTAMYLDEYVVVSWPLNFNTTVLAMDNPSQWALDSWTNRTDLESLGATTKRKKNSLLTWSRNERLFFFFYRAPNRRQCNFFASCSFFVLPDDHCRAFVNFYLMRLRRGFRSKSFVQNKFFSLTNTCSEKHEENLWFLPPIRSEELSVRGLNYYQQKIDLNYEVRCERQVLESRSHKNSTHAFALKKWIQNGFVWHENRKKRISLFL